jgi:NADPH-dependent glutamate synthase beta subunit-like oxidoreductase
VGSGQRTSAEGGGTQTVKWGRTVTAAMMDEWGESERREMDKALRLIGCSTSFRAILTVKNKIDWCFTRFQLTEDRRSHRPNE